MEQWSKAKEMFRTPKAHQENKGGKTIVTHFHTDGLWWYYSRHGVLVCKIYSIEDKGISGRLDMQNMRLTDSFSILFSNTVAAFSGHRPVVPADVVVDGRNQKEWRVTDGIFVAVHRTANWKRGQSRKKKKMDKTVEKYVNKTSSILQCSANRWWRKIQISFTSSSTQTLDKKKWDEKITWILYVVEGNIACVSIICFSCPFCCMCCGILLPFYRRALTWWNFQPTDRFSISIFHKDRCRTMALHMK